MVFPLTRGTAQPIRVQLSPMNLKGEALVTVAHGHIDLSDMTSVAFLLLRDRLGSRFQSSGISRSSKSA